MQTRHVPAGDGPRRPADDPRQRALLLWPGLDRIKLAQTRGEPRRVGRLVGRRAALPHETILRMLGCDPESAEQGRESGCPAPDATTSPAQRRGRRAPVFSPVQQR